MSGLSETIPVVDLGTYLAGEPGAMERTASELRFALTGQISDFCRSSCCCPSRSR